MKFKLLLLALLVSIMANAQRVGKERFNYHYQRNPIEKLNPEIKNYQVKVQVPWIEDEEQKKKDYEAELKAAEEEYQEEKKKYEEKSTGAKILDELTEDGPEKRHVSEPNFIPQPNLPVLESRISLDGFEKRKDNALLIKVKYHDIEVGEPEDIESTDLRGDVSLSRRVFIKQPVEYTISDTAGNVIAKEMFEKSIKGETIESREYPEGEKWQKFKKKGWEPYYEKNLKSYYEELAKGISNELNKIYGYSKIKRRTYLCMGKGRKYEYKEQLLALRKAQRAFQSICTDREESVEDIKKAIKIWKEELKDSKPSKRRARIGSRVTPALMCNIIESSILIGDYETAENYCEKVETLQKVQKRYLRKVEDLRDFLRNEKKRNKG